MRALVETVSSPDGRANSNQSGERRGSEGARQDPAPIAVTAFSRTPRPPCADGLAVAVERNSSLQKDTDSEHIRTPLSKNNLTGEISGTA
jgi:hypothetical protein